MRLSLFIIVVFSMFTAAVSQSGRMGRFSESPEVRIPLIQPAISRNPVPDEGEVIRIKTDLVMISVRVTSKNGRSTADIRREEFKLFEDGVEQELAFFSGEDHPLTVAVMLDMSYSSAFKLKDIQTAANAFVDQLRPQDRVMIVAFDEKVRVLCKPTNDRKVLRYAIEGARIGSGTNFYGALDIVVGQNMRQMDGRKAVVLLSDGVDTNSSGPSSSDILALASSTDVIVYPVRYNTYEDVIRNRRNNATIQYDDNDRPYILDSPLVRGERTSDYQEAEEFLNQLADQTGGRVYRVSSTTNLRSAFARIADELRKIYSLGYYPSEQRGSGTQSIRIRVYRPDLKVQTINSFVKN